MTSDAVALLTVGGVALTLIGLLVPALLPNPYEPDEDEGPSP